jgi:hypothetical protein
VFHIHFLSSRRHSVVIIDFWIFQYGEIAFSTARKRPRPEVTSSNDTATMISYWCPNACFGSIAFASYMRFSSTVKSGDLSISAARGRARPEVRSPIESSTRFPISVQYTFLV